MRTTPSFIVIHHSATDAHASLEDLRAAHLARGFDDIGYHYLIWADGSVRVGRPEDVQGAHASGMNAESIGICVVGNFDNENASKAAIRALRSLVIVLSDRYSIPGARVITHREVRLLRGESAVTACPGRFLQTEVETIRKELDTSLRPLEGDGVRVLAEPLATGLVQWLAIAAPAPKGQPHEPQRMERCEIALRANDDLEPLWRSSATWNGVGDSLTLRALMPEWLCPAGTQAQLTLESPSPGGKAVVPIATIPIQFPVWTSIRHTRAPYAARIEVLACERIEGHFLRVTGRVSNVGSLAWRNDDDRCPFRLGYTVITRGARKETLFEGRYDFFEGEHSVGATASFRVTLSLLQYPPGHYELYLDVVAERRFWFSSKGSPGVFVPFEAPEFAMPSHDKRARLMDPPVPDDGSQAPLSVIYIAPSLPLYDRSAGGRRLFEIFRMLIRSGAHVTLLYEQRGTSDCGRYIEALERIGVTLSDDPLGYLSSYHGAQPSLCVLGWYECADRYMSSVRLLLPHTRIAVDSVDIHWVRAERGAMYAGEASETLAVAKEKERSTYARSDEVWVVSEEDQSALLSELPGTKTRIIGIPCFRDRLYDEHGPQSSKEITFLFLGSFAHPPNESAALWAAEIIEALITRVEAPISLHIVGADPPDTVCALHNGDTVFVHGYVENTDDYFRSSTALLAPIRYGAGVKGKVCESICKGLPVVTTPIGAEGLGLVSDESALIAKTTEEFICGLEGIIRGNVDVAKLRANALHAALTRYSERAILPILLSSIRPPKIVIALVTHNARFLLQRCLESVLTQTQYPPFTIAVVSNGCTDGTLELLERFQGKYPGRIDIHRRDTNDFFVRPTNFVIENYPDSDIVLMNNDVEVLHAGWLINLMDAAYSTPHVAASGGRTVDPQGRISEAGAEIYAHGEGRNLGRGLDREDPSVLLFRYVGFVSGCLMYMRRDAIRTVGPLDDDFHPMYFEDAAWCYKAHAHGFKILYTPWSVALHREGSTAGSTPGTNMKRFQEINRSKFVAKFSRIEEFNG